VETASTDDAVKRFADDAAMQIAAMAPRYLTTSEVAEADKAQQTAIFDGQLAEEGKPEAVRGKIIEGKLNKWMKEICLLEQVSVMDSEKTIQQVQDALSKELGQPVKLTAFAR